MGIEFTGLDEATQERLQKQIEAMAAEGETSGNANGAGKITVLSKKPRARTESRPRARQRMFSP
jgi:hypothetical protein